jgi:hypothetical protein
LILCLAGLLTACAARVSPGEDAAARAIFDRLRRRDFAPLEAELPPRLRTAVTEARLETLAALIPDEAPRAVKLADATATSVRGGRLITVLRESIYSDRVLVVSTTLLEPAGAPPRFAGVNVQSYGRAALTAGRFSLTGKSSMQYFMLGLAVLIPLLLVYALTALARERASGWKWLWTPFILIGFTQLSSNWATGAIVFQPLSLLLLGASVSRGPLDLSPWVVTISLPLGALIYLGRVWFAAPPEDRDTDL